MRYLLAVVLVGAASLGAVAQTPVPPVVDATSAAAAAPLAAQLGKMQAQLDQLQSQERALRAQMDTVRSQWRVVEGKALASASLDPQAYGLDPTGKKFVLRNPQPRAFPPPRK